MKRKLSLLLAGMMLTSMLAACAGSTPAASTADSAASGTESSAVESTDGTDAPAELPEYAEISVEVFDRGTDGGKTDPTNNNWTNWIKEKVLADANIGVTYVPVPRSDETGALNNLMAAGTAPDICFTYSTDLVNQYAMLGGLYNMEPYVDTESLANFKEFLGPDKALPGRDFIRRGQDSETGEIFWLPARRINVAMRNTFIREDWLKTLDIPVPTTAEEFHAALKAFKTEDPGNVGTDKVLGYTMSSDVRWAAGNIMESFIDVNVSEKDRWINSVVDRSFLVPGYKEGVRYMNTLYNDGLIDPDFPLYTSDTQRDDLSKMGIVGAIGGNWDQIFRNDSGIQRDLQVNVPEGKFIAVDAFPSSDGLTHKGAYDAQGIKIFIPSTSKAPEAAMRYLNWISDVENSRFIQIGDEGIVHDLVDGIPQVKEAEGAWIQNSSMNLDYAIHVNGLDLGNEELNIRSIASGYSWPEEDIIAAYEIAMNNAKPGAVIPVTLTAGAPYSQTLIDKGVQLLAETITCSPEEFDVRWDAGIADWLASGAQEIIDERAEKYFDPAA